MPLRAPCTKYKTWEDFGLKLNWEALAGFQTWCILFCLQNGTLIRPASTRFCIGLQSHACSTGDRFVVRSMEEAGSWSG
jgi:hypothetical protein